jgi:hypothetical protein
MNESVKQLLGAGVLAHSVALVVAMLAITAAFGPDLAMLLRMYAGDFEPTRASIAFPWIPAVLGFVPAALLTWKKRYTLGSAAAMLPLLVAASHMRALFAASAGTP